LRKEEEVSKRISILAALLVLLVGVSAFAKDKKGAWFQQKMKLDPAALAEEPQAPSGRRAISVNGPTEHAEWDETPCDTTLETLWGGTSAAYYWQQPPNDPFINMLFEMPGDHGGRLEALQVAYYANGSTGTPDPDFYVWLSDGSFPLDVNPPYQAIAEFHLSYADIGWFPYYTEVPAWENGIYFDPGETFHIGFSHAFEPGDTQAVLSDDGVLGRHVSSGWNGTEWEDYWPYEFLVNAVICPFPVSVPTFQMRCTPSIGYATPGDPPANLYHIDLTQVLGYSQPITLSLLSVSPSAAVYASFSPNGAPCPYVSDVAISADAGVPYGDYVLTFQAVGDNGQARTCQAMLTLQPPYDEALVNFYHGFQRATNFGAIGDIDAGQNFVWYGTNYLFDGSLISAVEGDPQEDHMAYQIYDCQCMRFWPTQHLAKTHYPWCPGSSYEEYYGDMAYSHFRTNPSSIPGEHDSLFVVGLKDVECTDFSIIVRIHYNPTDDSVPELWTGVFEDWDADGEMNDWGHMDTLHNQMWMYDVDFPSAVFGILYAPFYDQLCFNMTFVHNPTEVSPWGDSCFLHGYQPGPGYLYRLMTARRYRDVGYWLPSPDDYSILMSGPPFSLNPGEKRVQIWVNFGRNLDDGLTWEQWRHKILRYVGFYRGDVNASDALELPALDISDLVYMQNYLFRGGPAPLPFADQGNVDGKGPYAGELDFECPKNNVDVQDLVYLLNYVYKGGPPPVDYVRFIPSLWSRPSLFNNPYWK
jgi:hypothetical protein